MTTLIDSPYFDPIYRGDSFAYKLEFDDINFDITGYEFVISFSKTWDSNSVLVKRFIAPDNINSESGILYLPFSTEDTLQLSTGLYHYSIRMITNEHPSKHITLLNSKIRCTQPTGGQI